MAAGTLQLNQTVITGGSNSPFNNHLAWSSLTVGGSIIYGPANPDGVSGKVTVKRAKRHYKWQRKDPPGSDGYTSTYHGISPKEFDIVFWFWTSAQYDRLESQVIPSFQIVGTKGKTNPVTIDYPGLSAIGISQITTDHIMQPEPTSEDKPDMWRWVVQVTEYLPPPQVNTAATPSTPLVDLTAWAPGSSTGRQPNPVVVANAQEIAALRNQLAGAQTGPPTPF
jgi:hypothetical protein